MIKNPPKKRELHNNDNIQVASDIAHKSNTLVNVWQQLFHRDKEQKYIHTLTRLNEIIFEVMMMTNQCVTFD